jgi:hypothetical protein
MKFMLLIHNRTAASPRSPEDWNQLSQDEQKAIFAEYRAINETPGVTTGLRLKDPAEATLVRVEDGETKTSAGPLHGAEEGVSGYLVFEADSLDDAIALAARIPSTRMGGAVEVRPIEG